MNRRELLKLLGILPVYGCTGTRKGIEVNDVHSERAIIYKGSYYLTYHRHADRRQVETCYPQFRQFLERKHAYDPEGCFESDWYRHYRDLFTVA